MKSAAWQLEPPLSAVIAAAITLLVVVLAGTVAVGIGELLAQRERIRLTRSILRDIHGCDPTPDQVRRFVEEVVEERLT